MIVKLNVLFHQFEVKTQFT